MGWKVDRKRVHTYFPQASPSPNRFGESDGGLVWRRNVLVSRFGVARRMQVLIR